MSNVINGAYYCNQNRTTELSNRMYKENVIFCSYANEL